MAWIRNVAKGFPLTSPFSLLPHLRRSVGLVSESFDRSFFSLSESRRSAPIFNKQAVTIVPSRYTSFFAKLPAEKLWKGVTSVSNSGKKRGRGKGMGKKTSRNLNKGQIIGVGRVNMVWPGLNSPIVQGKELVQQKQLPEDPDFHTKLHKLRDGMGSVGILKLSPLERGWSGPKMPGRSIGPPDPIGEDKFEGFDTTVLEFKAVSNMKGNLGRVRSMSAFVITGNGNGLAGFGLGKAQMGNAALRKARNRAGQKLMYVERYNNHTVLHDFYTRFNRVRIFVSKKPEGHGLVCHRAIREICKAVGIKDIYAKVEGPSKNIQHVTKAFMIGLLNQKSFEKIAEDTKLNVVEFRKERDNYAQVMAKPKEVKSIKTVNDMDINLFLNEGKVASQKRKWPLFYERLPSWENHILKTERFRNRDEVRTQLMAQYGEVRSFLADRYPECRQSEFHKKKEENS